MNIILPHSLVGDWPQDRLIPYAQTFVNGPLLPVSPVLYRLAVIGKSLWLYLCAVLAINAPVLGQSSATNVSQELKAPIDLKITVNQSTPFKGESVLVTLEFTPLVNARSVKVQFTGLGQTTITGQQEFVTGALVANTKRVYTTRARLLANGRAIIKGSVRIATSEGTQVGDTRELYFLVNKGNTFYGQGGFINVQSDSVQHKLQQARLTGDGYKQAYDKAMRELTIGTVSAKKDAGVSPAKPDPVKKSGQGRQAAATFTVSGTVNWTDPNGLTHPVKGAVVEIKDEDVVLDEVLSTTTTNDAGVYTVSVTGTVLDDPDIYIKVYTKSDYCFVVRKGDRGSENNSYSVRSTVIANVTSNTTLSINIPKSPPGTDYDPYDAFSVYSAIVESAKYVETRQGTALPKLAVEFPGDESLGASYYDGVANYLNILAARKYAWDVLHHEYGHYVATQLSFDTPNIGDPQMGAHSSADNLAEYPGRTKLQGFNIAWQEGWPTFFGISLQRERGLFSYGSVGAGDLDYDNQAGLQYNIEIADNRLPKGEDNEASIQQILWDIYDSNQEDDKDILALGDAKVWETIRSAKPHRLFDVWKGFTNGKQVSEIVKYGANFAKHKVASLPTEPANNAAITTLDNPVTFKWDANGGGPSNRNNSFTIEFYDKDFNPIPFNSPPSPNNSITLTASDLKTIFGSRTEIKWLVKSSNTTTPITGPYTSPAFTLKYSKPDIVFVIDDTGSMGEEIGAVKNSIIRILSLPTSTTNTVYQLVTFKDNVTTRTATNDLTTIRNQVSALVASGGGACPEASVEALEATDDLVKDGGIVYLATDASPHPGLTTANAASRFAKRGVRAYVLLSGDCSSAADSRTVADYEAKYGAKVPFSGNQDSDEKSERSETAKEQSAIEAFSFLAQETKGVFAFVPEVNTRRSEDVARYENIAFNIIQGAIGNAISFIEPSKAPGGSTVLLTITGTNTNFNAGSSLVFDETGVTFGTPTILSSSKITVSATIPAGTPLGLKNITVTTPLADGSTEMSKGTGLFEVIAAPTTPTILGITPPTGSVGQALTVTINGINTNFTNESVPNLGSGITIGSVQAKSSTELVAAVTIAPDATIGYRDVRVTTGSEVATENVTGPFLVTEAGCTPIVIPSVVISASSVATLTASGCSGSLVWSTGETTGSITVGPLISSTVISATCTTGACVVTASGTITVMPATGGAFALIAPTYDCATGAFRFNTTGGDGSAITYWAVGITGPTTNPNDDVDAQLAQDIRDGRPNIAPLTLYAQQSGMMVSYTWNALAACSSSTTTPPSTTGCGSPSGTIGQPLVLVAPTYNCSTGVIQFNTSGGNGSPIEFMAIGITGWTTNCIDNLDPGNTDNNTYTIMARQNGVTVSLAWTRPCASLRVARETGSGLNISVLGNPTTADRVEVELRGAEGQAVRLQVIDSNGRSVSDLQIEQAAVSERRTVPLGRTAGIYFIKASTTTEAKTVKVVKQ